MIGLHLNAETIQFCPKSIRFVCWRYVAPCCRVLQESECEAKWPHIGHHSGDASYSWGTASAWRGVIAALGGGFCAVTTSLLGYGSTQERRTATDTSIDRQAEFIERSPRMTRVGRVMAANADSGGSKPEGISR